MLDDLAVRLTIGDVRFRRSAHHNDKSVHGYTIEHRRPDAPELRCTVGLSLCGRAAEGLNHNLEQADPLTISPSLGCPVCGWHVFIREGAIEVVSPMAPGTPLVDAKDFPMMGAVTDDD